MHTKALAAIYIGCAATFYGWRIAFQGTIAIDWGGGVVVFALLIFTSFGLLSQGAALALLYLSRHDANKALQPTPSPVGLGRG